MIPLFADYPKATARTRVIALKDRLKRTVETLTKARIFHVEIAGELKAVDRKSIENACYRAGYYLTCISSDLNCLQATEGFRPGDGIALNHNRPFRISERLYYWSVAGGVG